MQPKKAAAKTKAPVTKSKGKKKKQIRKLAVDCTHPVEDGIMDAANFVSQVKCPVPNFLLFGHSNKSKLDFYSSKNLQ